MEFIDLAAQYKRLQSKIDARIQAVLSHGRYILGPEVSELENKLSDFCGAKYAISCANGTDALLLALMALGAGKGDAVFCPSFTFAGTAEMIPFANGATPVFVDSLQDTYNMDPESLVRSIEHARSLGLRPVGVIPVDLFGLPADYDQIETIAEEHDLWIICDSAQGFGANHKGRTTGSIGKIATASFFPAKPLGCYGDGGCIFTSDDAIKDLLQSYRFHGKGTHKYDNERIGQNSRLDTIQAAVLLEKLTVYAEEIELRQAVASRYTNGLSNIIKTPYVPDGLMSVWAQYTLQAQSEDERSRVMTALQAADVPSTVYYPRPLHQQTAYKDFPRDPAGLRTSEALSKTVFSIPMHPYLTEENQQLVIGHIQCAIG